VARSVGLFVTGSNAAAPLYEVFFGSTRHGSVWIPNAVVRREPRSSIAETRHTLGVAAGARIVLVVARLEPRRAIATSSTR